MWIGFLHHYLLVLALVLPSGPWIPGVRTVLWGEYGTAFPVVGTQTKAGMPPNGSCRNRISQINEPEIRNPKLQAGLAKTGLGEPNSNTYCFLVGKKGL